MHVLLHRGSSSRILSLMNLRGLPCLSTVPSGGSIFFLILVCSSLLIGLLADCTSRAFTPIPSLILKPCFANSYPCVRCLAMQVALTPPNTRFQLPTLLAGRDWLPATILWRFSKLLSLFIPLPRAWPGALQRPHFNYRLKKKGS